MPDKAYGCQPSWTAQDITTFRKFSWLALQIQMYLELELELDV